MMAGDAKSRYRPSRAPFQIAAGALFRILECSDVNVGVENSFKALGVWSGTHG
jgi:hypothetical protein